MIKVSVMYPYTAGARFDHTYYREKHMPMVKQRLGAACLYYTVDKGIAGGAPAPIPCTWPGATSSARRLKRSRQRASRTRRRSSPTSRTTRIFSPCFKSAK